MTKTKAFSIEVEGIEIVGQLYMPAGNAPYPVVCVCHGIPSGNPPDPSDGGYNLLAEKIRYHGFAVLIFNFRGTGLSGGNLDLLGWTRDLQAVVDYLYDLPFIDKTCLALLGFSGGAAVSVYCAAQDSRISCVAVCACPAHFNFVTATHDAHFLVRYFRDMGTIRDMSFPQSHDDWANGFRILKPVDYIVKIGPRPLLIIHGEDDVTVAPSHAYRLYESACKPKKLVLLKGAGHNIRRDERIMEAFMGWLRPLCHK